jgi:hypothetical protein
MTPDERLARLDDYERGLAADEGWAEAYEEELFTRALADEAPELTFRDSLAGSVEAMGRRGTIDLFPSAQAVAALRARADLRVAYYDLAQLPDGRIRPPDDADVVVTRVALRTGRPIERLEVEVGFAGGEVLKTMPDVTFDRDAGEVFFCCDGDLARGIVGRPFGRFWAIEGERRTLLAEIVVDTGA